MAEKERPADAKAKAVLDFNTLYLDTNVLTESNWPSLSVRLETLLSLALLCKVAVVIPEAVEKEAEDHWLRNIRNSVASLESAAGDFRRLSRGVGGSVEIRCEKEEELIRRYREVVSGLKERFKIAHCPMTTRPLVDLFDLATRYVMPFEESKQGRGRGEGKGFQDAVILSSILEHLKTSPKISGALVSTDGSFLKVDLAQFMPSCGGIACRVITLEEAVDRLSDQYLDEQITKPWEEEGKNAMSVVEGMGPELYTFVKDRLQEIPLSDIGVRGSLHTLDRALDVKSVKPHYVQTPVPNPAKPDRSVRMAIAVSAELDVVGTRTYVPLSVLAGPLNYLAGPGVRTPLPPPQYDRATATWWGGIEASADVRKRDFTNVKLLSLVSMEEIGSQKWFRAAAENKEDGTPPAS